MYTTDHARTRMQQRAIAEQDLHWLERYGRKDYHQGARIYYFDQRALRRLQTNENVNPQTLDHLKNKYMVCALETPTIITVGHKCRHFKRNHRQRVAQAA